MNWIIGIVIGLVVLVLWSLKRLALVAEETAREQLARGALVIDVRTRHEFESNHVPNVINIPFDELEKRLPQHVTDKQQVLLVHCLSRGRSGLAKHQLKGMGDPNAFNLGSLVRAKRIVAGQRSG